MLLALRFGIARFNQEGSVLSERDEFVEVMSEVLSKEKGLVESALSETLGMERYRSDYIREWDTSVIQSLAKKPTEWLGKVF